MDVDALVVVDMQEGLLQDDEKHDLTGVVERINRLADRVRKSDGRVLFIQHDGTPEDGFAPFTPGWEVLSSLEREPTDFAVRKTMNDAFFGTELQATLERLQARRVFVCGWATDFCVDATVRSAVALGFDVVVPSDCHTVSDRPHLGAQEVMEHHHWIWSHLISERPVEILPEAEIRFGPSGTEALPRASLEAVLKRLRTSDTQ